MCLHKFKEMVRRYVKFTHRCVMKKFFILLLLAISFSSQSSLISKEYPLCPIKQIPLRTDYIGLEHPVTTKSPAAQLYFNQGLTFMYAFNHDAAYCSFQQAAEQDPKLAMAYWGMALALGQNINIDITPNREKSAYEAIQKALELSSDASENEQDYIKALSKRYSNAEKPDIKSLAEQYSKEMNALMKKYPDDPDAAVLYAESGLDLNPWRQWSASGEPTNGILEILAVLEGVLKRNPMHLGANHFYIHAIEASNNPEKALMCAERLRKLLPSSGHLLHMPSHIYILVGDYHLAAECNEDAVAADREYIREYGMAGIYPLHYLSHNLYFLSRAYSMEGRFMDAYNAAKDLENFYKPNFGDMPDLEYYISNTIFVLLRFGHWKEVLKDPAPESSMPVTNVLWHFARGIAYAALNQPDKAEEEQKAFLDAKSKVPQDAIFGYNKASQVFMIAENLLKSKIALSQKNSEQEIEFLRKAIAVQDTLNYNEPPDWFFPVRENLGGALLRNKQFKEAEKVFREDLSKHPRNGRSLFGLMESLKAQSRETDAYWVKKEFEKAWKYSDVKLIISDL